MYFSLLNCGNEKYCVTLDKCIIGQAYGKFIIDFSSHVCNRTEECIIDIFDDTDPFANDTFTDIITEIATTEMPKKEKDMDEKINEISKRAKILRTFSEERDYENFNNFDQNLAEKYLKILEKSGYMIISILGTKKKVNNDAAEAFLYAHLFLKDLGNSDFQFDNAEDIATYKLRMKELKKREKLLMSGREI
jgi:hypothetical protein